MTKDEEVTLMANMAVRLVVTGMSVGAAVDTAAKILAEVVKKERRQAEVVKEHRREAVAR